jgi:capsid assembly protease
MPRQTAMDFVAREAWAIRSEWLETICDIAARQHEYAGDISALEQRMGRPLANTRSVTLRDGVAIIPVSGPLFRHANMMTELSGATSYGSVALDLRAALDDPAVRAIILDIDSPGGAVKGAGELAKQIHAGTAEKEIVAYVGGDAASAAYWLASAASRIVADESAQIGSIGTMIGMKLSEGAKAGERAYSFVSSQSPLKNADPGTDVGSREIQRMTDELAAVFIGAVANYRGVSEEEVMEKYGQGAVFAGVNALERGMIDELGTLEALISTLSNEKPAIGGIRAGARLMPKTTDAGAQTELPEITAEYLKANHADVVAVLLAEGAATADMTAALAVARQEGIDAERERIAEIEAMALPGCEELVAQFKADSTVSPSAAAMQLLKAARTGSAAGHLAVLRTTEQNLASPKPVAVRDQEGDDLEAEIAADLAAAKSAGLLS